MSQDAIKESLEELEDVCESYAELIVKQMMALGCDLVESELVADAEVYGGFVAIERLRAELASRPRKEQPHRFDTPL